MGLPGPSFHEDGEDPTPDTLLTQILYVPPHSGRDSFGWPGGKKEKRPPYPEGSTLCPTSLRGQRACQSVRR